jgi:farnesyl diphosphate synthase
MTETLETRLLDVASATEAMLDRLLQPHAERGEIMRPPRLLEVMRYVALAPGKRLRSFLLIESAKLFGRDDEGVLRAAAAIECVHAYSLVHTGLRRGRPATHRDFSEATAVLAGDALLTLAFDILADPAVDRDPLTCAALIGALARAVGIGGMMGGQMLDLESKERTLPEEDIRRLQAMKTGALFRHAAQAGALLGGAGEDDRHRLITFGEKFGLAYQIADDLLDATEDAHAAVEKGSLEGNATLVALHGIEAARTFLAVASAEAAAIMEPFGGRGETLAEAARYVGIRQA